MAFARLREKLAGSDELSGMARRQLPIQPETGSTAQGEEEGILELETIPSHCTDSSTTIPLRFYDARAWD
jgi:hypothetical protein